MTCKVTVVKNAMNTKATRVMWSPNHFASALNPQFLTALIWRGKYNLNPNIRPNWRALAAEYESAVQCNVVGEAPLRVLHAVVPMENDRETKLVSHGRSPLQIILSCEKKIHTWAKIMVLVHVSQECDRLKI
jgi:hypothetical protein